MAIFGWLVLTAILLVMFVACYLIIAMATYGCGKWGIECTCFFVISIAVAYALYHMFISVPFEIVGVE